MSGLPVEPRVPPAIPYKTSSRLHLKFEHPLISWHHQSYRVAANAPPPTMTRPAMTRPTIRKLTLAYALIALLAFAPPFGLAQSQGTQHPPASSQAPPAQAPAPSPPQPAPQAPPAPSQQTQDQQQSGQPGFAISVTVPVVNVDVVVTDNDGNYLNNLKKENFRITEEGVPQTITNFGATDAPITMVLLLEFSSRGYGGFFAYVGKYWSTALFPALLQKDWVALETFAMKTRVEVDFTQNKDEVMEGLYHLYFPGFSESNLFDAILETVDRLKDVKGKKSIVVLASGVDTFSKHTLDQTMKQLRQSDVSIF